MREKERGKEKELGIVGSAVERERDCESARDREIETEIERERDIDTEKEGDGLRFLSYQTES